MNDDVFTTFKPILIFLLILFVVSRSCSEAKREEGVIEIMTPRSSRE